MQPLSTDDRRAVVETAVATIAHGVADPARPLPPLDPLRFSCALQQARATFVTLYRRTQLRGCRGSLTASDPLILSVAHSARSAAFFDDRFKPVSAREIPHLVLHISLLSSPHRLEVTDESDLLASLRPGVDGLILREQSRQALFLPSVWKKLPEPEEFLAQLKAKAGLPISYWSSSLEFESFTVEEFEGHAAACVAAH